MLGNPAGNKLETAGRRKKLKFPYLLDLGIRIPTPLIMSCGRSRRIQALCTVIC